MEAKPFSLQSPENIAKEYGGNKQKIAAASQMGLVDPTVAVMAGMFIDRMRSAQAMEQAPTQTVAQQVMAPQPAPPPVQQGLGGMPLAGGPPPPPQAAPPQIAPQQAPQGPGFAAGGFLQQSPSGAPMPQAPMSLMAPAQDSSPYASPQDYGRGPPPQVGFGLLAQPGGSVDPRMSTSQYPTPARQQAGLTTLPIPDNMFDEPSNGSYAGGGIVAFASGGQSRDDMLRAKLNNAKTVEEYNAVVREIRAESPHMFKDLVQGATVGPPVLAPEQDIPVATPARGNADEAWGKFGAGLKTLMGGMHPSDGDTIGVGAPDGPAMDRGVRGPTAAQMASLAAPSAAPGGMDMASPPATAAQMAALAAGVPTSAARAGAGASRGLGAIPPSKGVAMPTTAAVDASASEGLSFADLLAKAKGVVSSGLGDVPDKRQKQLDDYYENILSPQAMSAQKKADMWNTLAQIGFGTAASKSPYFGQAVGEAASAALPGMQEAIKARKAEQQKALEGLSASEAKQYDRAVQRFAVATDIAASDVKVQSDNLTRDQAERFKSRDIELELKKELFANERTSMQVAATIKAALINANAPQAADKFVARYVASKISEDPKANVAKLALEGAEQYINLVNAQKGQTPVPDITASPSRPNISGNRPPLSNFLQ